MSMKHRNLQKLDAVVIAIAKSAKLSREFGGYKLTRVQVHMIQRRQFILFVLELEEVAERLKALVLKTRDEKSSVGSNPTLFVLSV